MNHPNLSTALNETLRRSQDQPAIDISAQAKGMMLEARTKNSRYVMVVVNPDQCEVALASDNSDIHGTDLWVILGAGYGGSMMRIGHVEKGADIRMRRLVGGIIQTSPVESFSILNDTAEAKRMVMEAESRRPRIMTEAEAQDQTTRAESVMAEFVKKEFPEEFQADVSDAIAKFGNIPAKGTALGVLSQGHKHGKFQLALSLLQRDIERHWNYQPPEVAGDPEFLPMNAHRWEDLYEELGVPLPDQS